MIDLERRYKICLLMEHEIISVLKALDRCEMLTWAPERFNLPEDAKVIGVNYVFSYQAFEVLIYSKSFDVVPDGQKAPYVGDVHPMLIEFGVLKRKSIFDSHEPADKNSEKIFEKSQQSWRERDPLL